MVFIAVGMCYVQILLNKYVYIYVHMMNLNVIYCNGLMNMHGKFPIIITLNLIGGITSKIIAH